MVFVVHGNVRGFDFISVCRLRNGNFIFCAVYGKHEFFILARNVCHRALAACREGERFAVQFYLRAVFGVNFCRNFAVLPDFQIGHRHASVCKFVELTEQRVTFVEIVACAFHLYGIVQFGVKLVLHSAAIEPRTVLFAESGIRAFKIAKSFVFFHAVANDAEPKRSNRSVDAKRRAGVKQKSVAIRVAPTVHVIVAVLALAINVIIALDRAVKSILPSEITIYLILFCHPTHHARRNAVVVDMVGRIRNFGLSACVPPIRFPLFAQRFVTLHLGVVIQFFNRRTIRLRTCKRFYVFARYHVRQLLQGFQRAGFQSFLLCVLHRFGKHGFELSADVVCVFDALLPSEHRLVDNVAHIHVCFFEEIFARENAAVDVRLQVL